MAKYLWHGSYTVEGINGVLKEGGSARVKAVQALVTGLGGTVESFYFGFGKDDFYVTVDLPGNVDAAAAAISVAAAGGARVQTVTLLTAAEIDQAVKTAVNYRRPGG